MALKFFRKEFRTGEMMIEDENAQGGKEFWIIKPSDMEDPAKPGSGFDFDLKVKNKNKVKSKYKWFKEA